VQLLGCEQSDRGDVEQTDSARAEVHREAEPASRRDDAEDKGDHARRNPEARPPPSAKGVALVGGNR